jgi:DNA-binding NarL/FixJ family response regulator
VASASNGSHLGHAFRARGYRQIGIETFAAPSVLRRQTSSGTKRSLLRLIFDSGPAKAANRRCYSSRIGGAYYEIEISIMRKSDAEPAESAEVAQGDPATAPKTRVPFTHSRNRGSEEQQNPINIIGTHVLIRECLGRFLSAECNVQVKSFSTLEEWQAAYQPTRASLVVACQCGSSKADLLKEIDQLSQILDRIGSCPAVIFSDNEDPDLIVQILGKNVRGYVPTSLSIDVAIQAMKLVRAGGVFVPQSGLMAAPRVTNGASTTLQKGNGLTARQAAVLDALRRGKPNKIIAYELKMRESTVKVHVRNIMKKLHATNRTEAAYLADRLLSGDDPSMNDEL